jgi:hypothetical protein
MKKIFIITVSVIVALVLITGVIAIGIGLYHDFKQEGELISECKEIKKLTNAENLDAEKINEMLTRKISTGEYLKVEEALKEYLTARFQNIRKISQILNDEKLEKILTIDNYKNDGPEFVTTKEYIENTKQELQELKNKYEELFTEETVMSYINNKNLDSYYVKFYKQELIGNPEESKDNTVEHNIDGIITILDSYNSVIDFLVTNKNSWKIEEENIIFANEELSNKFLEIVNNMLENIPGTLIEKDFGTYEIPADWVESVAHSTNSKFFYVKEGEENENRPNNISVNEGTNKYSESEHEKFRMAILKQLSMQIGRNEDVKLNANGSNTKNGYLVYTFSIKDGNTTTTQYYIIGEYKYVLVHETTFGNSTETDNAAQKIIDTFKWKEEE